MTAATTRKHHLRDTKFGRPACAGRRAQYSREHIAMPVADFIASESKCEKCAASKLFAFLSRTA